MNKIKLFIKKVSINFRPQFVQEGLKSNRYILNLQPEAIGESNVEILASAGFTERVDQFKVNVTDTVTVNETKTKKPEQIIITSLPNPFTKETIISYEITQKSKTSLEIYNYHGQLISFLVDEIKLKGKHKILFDGRELPDGVYFIVLKTEQGIQTKKIVKL